MDTLNSVGCSKPELSFYDGNRVIQERNGNLVPTVSYTRGSDLSGSLEGAGGIGGLLARSTGNGSTWTSHAYYHADGNGNITTLLDGTQSVVAAYRYDPFGNALAKTGTLADANLYRFSSKELHAKSGLYYYLYRFYDPNLQRWVNKDPLGDPWNVIRSFPRVTGLPRRYKIAEGFLGANLYEFVKNHPEGKVDPNGLTFYRGDPVYWPKPGDLIKGCKPISCKWACRLGGVACAAGCEFLTAGWGLFACISTCTLVEQSCEDNCPPEEDD